MKVVVRVRPAISEQESQQRSVVQVLDELALMFDPKEEVEHFYFRGVKQLGRNLLRKANKELRFNFDTVFGDEATNEDVHTATTMPILDGLLDGYNCSVFAYGATGSGKTFTMLGNAENPGITVLTVMELYERLETLRSDMIIDLAVSYLEVYNENVKDLLTPSGILQVREDQHRGVIVPGLTLHKPKGAEELLEMLRLGNHRRTQHPTDANAESSRSHAVFTVYVKQQDLTSGNKSGLSASRVSKMALIDLAGSERASMVSRGNGSRLREGANINKSLLALGNCINALADKKGHVPFRNSKLTRLLKDSLDGNCRTVMIAAVSPAACNYEDTYNTLKYAARAKTIKTNSKQNMMDIVVPTGQHMKVIQDLQKEVADLKRLLHESRPPVLDVAVPLAVPLQQQPSTTNAVDGQVDAIQTVIKDMFAERETLTRQFLEVSCRVREMELRVQRRQRCMERLALIAITSNRMDESASKMDNAVARMVGRREREFAERTALGKRLAKNSAALAQAEETAAATNSQVLCEWLKTQHSRLDLKVAQFREHHACRAALIQEQETSRCDRLLSEILRVVQRQYLVLLANGLATSDIIEDFNALLKQVEGVKEVAWADQMREDEDSATQLNIGSILNLCVAPLDMILVAEASEEQQERPVSLKVATIASSDQTVASTAESDVKKGRLYSPTCGKLLSTNACLSAKPNHVTFISAVSNSTHSPHETVIQAGQPVDAGLNSTFSKEPLEDEVTKVGDTIPRRRLKFDVGPQLLVPASQAAAVVSSSESVTGVGSAAIISASIKRPWRDGEGGKIGAAAKKLKPCSSLSNLSTAKSLRKFGFQSMFDKPTRLAEGTDKSKLSAFTKFTKITPVKRHVLESINVNGNGIRTVVNDPQSSFLKRPLKVSVKPSIEPRTNALSRQRSKSTTNLKTPQ